ncbi:hypothetical protein [Chromobacterium haemolyticum]|uniref:hypothetical protein n=1 Tax=Chromobacterium haemolyticum TaxID=394935 RepID=UPI0012F74887|nr:hypothetical protein [Chromobacterium haemolyticum]
MHPFEAIPDLKLVSIGEYGGLEPLTLKQRNRLLTTIEILLHPRTYPCPLFLYRGDSKNNLRAQLFSSTSDWRPDNELYSRIFFFGQKARHFWMDPTRETKARNWLRNLHDDSMHTFTWLFSKIGQVLSSRERRVKNFCKENHLFAEYFKNPANEQDFLTKTQSLPPRLRQRARDYYLYCLHTYGRRGIHEQTLLVSTTSDINVARNFRHHDGENVITYLFVPSPYSKYCVSSRLLPQDYTMIREAGTPSYKRNSGLYPEQKEYGLRGAVFPQLILGIHDLRSNEFIVNPHLLAMYESGILNLRHYGIWIDQTNFEVLIKQTGFLRFGELDEDDFYHGHDLTEANDTCR